MNLNQVYEHLLLSFGPQGWWPMKHGFSPVEWEVCVGAILTQNTSWRNVDKALAAMKSKKLTSVSNVLCSGKEELEQAVRPSGFYKQKAERLKAMAEFVEDFGGFRSFSRTVTRDELLSVKGLGPETVDSILLYALNRPVFVIDTYTRRVFTRLGFNLVDRGMKFGRQAPSRPWRGMDSLRRKVQAVKPREEYELWRWFFESTLPRANDENKAVVVNVYKEFHALIVELAKRHCRKRPLCKSCPLNSACQKVI